MEKSCTFAPEKQVIIKNRCADGIQLAVFKMKVLFRVIALVFVLALGSACHAQNLGSLITSDDYFEQFYSNGALVPDRNIKVSFYQNAVEVQYYQKGTRDLTKTSRRIIYYYDHTESNGNKVYYDNPNSFFKSKFTISSDGSTIDRTSSVLHTVASRGFRDVQPQSSVPMGGNGYDNGNSYNSSSGSSSGSPSRKTCPDCNGKRYQPYSYTDCAINTSYHNQAGNTCYICGYSTKHCHYPCNTCQSRGTVESY